MANDISWLTKTIVIPGVSHVINYQAAEVVENAVLEFLT